MSMHMPINTLDSHSHLPLTRPGPSCLEGVCNVFCCVCPCNVLAVSLCTVVLCVCITSRYHKAIGMPGLIHNSFAYDLGIQTDSEVAALKASPEKLQAKLEEFAKAFATVVITDYMEESLLLLKRDHCWQLDDVRTRTQGRRPHRDTATLFAMIVRGVASALVLVRVQVLLLVLLAGAAAGAGEVGGMSH
jgi:hypothetical protein